MKDQSSRATENRSTSAASSAPKAPACTKGKCATSRKLSASSPADARARHVGSSPTMNDGVFRLGDSAERGERLSGGAGAM